MSSSSKARWISGLFLLGVCLFLVVYYFNSLWTTSIDLAHHYALVARISENWHLPTNDDPSLEEMNFYPRYSHRLAAILGGLVRSPLEGMQFVALVSLAVLWSGFALIFHSLLPRMRWLLLAFMAVLLLANHVFIHLELFGNELLNNYFFPQLVAQAVAILVVACVLWMERTGLSPVASYLVLGICAPVIEQFHLLPALEILTVLALLVIMNIPDARTKNHRTVAILGLLICLGSISLTALNPIFARMLSISEINGLLKLNYTATLTALALECSIVIALSAFLAWQWMRLDPGEERNSKLAFKYLGLLGLAIAGTCLAQIIMVKIGYGSEYACKKYAFGLNTLLLLGMVFLPFLLPAPLRTFPLGSQSVASIVPAAMLQNTFPGLFVLLAVFSILPPLSTRTISVSDVVSVERFVSEHAAVSGASAKYDYGIGLFPNLRDFDYLISIGVLKTPRANNASDLLNGYPPSKPRRISRIFTRVGSRPWDVPACRQYVSPDGLAILDGQCVLSRIAAAGAGTSP